MNLFFGNGIWKSPMNAGCFSLRIARGSLWHKNYLYRDLQIPFHMNFNSVYEI